MNLIRVVLILLACSFSAAQAQPTLSKVFTPDTIGPGSVSTITFTITNGSASPVTGLAFTDTLPAAVMLADPASATTDCDLGVSGSLSAPDGGSTITLSDAQIGGSQTCTITVDVTAATPGSHTNPAVTLNSSAGSSMSLPMNLTVDTSLPGFSKSFAPSSVPLGGRSTLTFTIDNSANASTVDNLDFTDNFPAGLEIADPANASTDCGTTTVPPTLTADAGSSVVVLDADGIGAFPAVAAGATCMVTVDVTTTGSGAVHNITNELLAAFVSAGKASATLTVTVTPLAIEKSFTVDPVPPGGSTTLEFTITNFDRGFSATGISFSDNLGDPGGTLLGLAALAPLPTDPCGAGSTMSGTGTLTLSGGTLPPGGSCTFQVITQVPAGATPGTYTNTTSPVSATVDGSPVVGNTASEDLFVEPIPVLTKEFLEVGTLAPDPVIDPGDDVVLRFTVTNTSATSGATDVEFIDELTDGSGGFPPDTTSGFLPSPVSVSLPPTPDPPCGAGSSLALITFDTDRQRLELTGGSLDPAPGAGATCTFDVTVTVPAELGPGVFLNTTEQPTATVDGATRVGQPASDTLTVIAAPSLSKVFMDDPVGPGTSVTLEFVLTYSPDASGDATAITFTDDLTALAPPLAGLVATALPLTEACDPDGPGGDPGTGTLSGSMGDTLLTFLGGELSPGESCAFSVTLDVPMGAASGSYINTTSGVSATVGGLAATSPAASDDLDVTGLVFSKEFVGNDAANPVLPGDTLTLRFTIDNIHPTDDATITFFTDNLDAALTGLAATSDGVTSVDTCGGSISGTSFLIYVGGSVMSGMSCTIELEVLVPLGAADGVYTNTTSNLSATQGGPVSIDPAINDLVVDANRLQLTKSFTDDPVAPGDPVTLEFVLTNLDASQAASGVAFSDDLGAALTGLTFGSVLLDTCSGTVGGTGTDMITVSGVSLAASGSCTLRLSLNVPGGAAAGVYTNTTSSQTGTIGGLPVTGDAASDDLEVIQLLTFSKSFDGPTTATGSATITFSITNPSATDTATGISFTDDLNAVIPGLIATSLPAMPCGTGSSISGIGFLTFSGAELAPMGMCSFDVDVLVPASATVGTFPNTTSDLFQSGIKVADPATADLVIEPPPTFAKVFGPDSTGVGLVSTLTFTIDNSASALAASNLDFTDNLPVGLTVANPSNAMTDCTGGTLTASIGTGVVTYTGGTVAIGSSCTVQVDVVTSTNGQFDNVSGNLTSSSGDSGFAQDTLTANAAPGFAKVFAPDMIAVGGTSTLTFTIDNSSSTVDATALDFTDNLPAAVVVATPAMAMTDCIGGTLTAASATGVVSYTGGTVSAGAPCSVQVDVTSATVGAHVNTSGDLTSLLGNSGTAVDTLTVNPAPGFSKAFSPNPTSLGSTTTLSFTIDNSGSTADATALDFTDSLPLGLVVATTPNAMNSCMGGTLTATAGTGVISYTGGTVPAGNSCVIDVDILTTMVGTLTNTSGDLTSSLGNSGMATDMILVVPQPVFSKAFAPASVGVNLPSTLTFTVDNSGSTLAATSLDFTDTLPAGMIVATPNNASMSCTGGTLTAVAGSGSVAYTGGTVNPSATCTIQVNVVATTSGDLVNTTGDLTSSLGNSGTASDTLTANFAPGFTKAFSPGTIQLGGTSTLTFTIDNSGSTVDATALDFTDNLPADVVLATPSNATTDCIGGTLTAVDGGNVVTFTGGSVATATSCTVAVNVTSSTVGDYVNLSGDLTSSLGNSGTATDMLRVNPAPTFSKAFGTDPTTLGATVTLAFTIDNSGSTVDATALDFTDNLPAGLQVASTPNVGDTCVGGTLTALAGANMVTYSGGTVPGMGQCSISVDLTSTASGDLVNTTGDLTSSLGNSGTATASLRVNPQPGFSKTFAPNPMLSGDVTTLTFTIDNTGSTVDASMLAFTDSLPSDVFVAATPNAGTTCIGGSVTATAGASSVSYSGGTALAGEACTVSVDVTSIVAGTRGSTSGNLTSNLGDSGTATDSVTVNPVADLMVTKDNGTAASIPGSMVSYMIVASNAGPNVETAALLTDTFAAELGACTVISMAAGGATGNTVGPVLATSLNEMLNLPVGSTVTYVVDCTLAADATGPDLINSALLIPQTTTDTDLTNNDATDMDSVTPVADLVVTKTDGATAAPPGAALTYTVDVRNDGPSDDPTVSLTDNLPVGLTCASFTSTASGGATGNTASGSGGLTETLSMPAGSSVAYTLNCVVDVGFSGNLSNTASATASVTDPDTTNDAAIDVTAIAGIMVSPTSGLTTSEGGATDTFSVALATAPAADVDVVIASSDIGEGTVAPTVLTFTNANATTPQVVTVTGADDPGVDGTVAYSVTVGPAVSADLAYDGLAGASVQVSNADNDIAGITVNPTAGLTTTEFGGTASFNVLLNTQPGASVAIALSSSDPGEGTVSPAMLTFTSANFGTAQAVTVTGVNDGISDMDTPFTIVLDPAVSTDLEYGGLDPADVSVTNTANVDPVAMDDTATVPEDGMVPINVLANDLDNDAGDTLTVIAVGMPSNGTAAYDAVTNRVIYTPAADYNGGDAFTYTIEDSLGGTDMATVVVTVTAVNDNPVANPDSITVAEGGTATTLVGGAMSVLANDFDVDGDSLTAVVVTLPVNGNLLLNGDGTFMYVHDGSETTRDSFSYSACSAVPGCDIAVVSIVIGGVNDAPVAIDDAISVNEGGTATQLSSMATSVLANDTDADGDALTATVVSGPGNGTLALSLDGTFSYTHDGSETTSDSFTYNACDPAAACDSAVVSITVVPVNDPPVASDDAASVAEGGTTAVLAGGSTSVLANDTDADGDTLTASLVSGAANGTFMLNADGTFVYTHDGSETASDSVTYAACDPSTSCDQATVTITVTPVNDAPVANDDAIAMAQEGGTASELVGGATSVLANDTDADGDTLTASLVSGAANGTFMLNADGTFVYTHDGSEATSDSVTYEACDPSAACDQATVMITIGSVNDAPVANDDAIAMAQEGGTASELVGGATSVLANDTDAEGDALTASLVSGAANGTFMLNADGTFVYTHDGSETTSDSVTYEACDPSAACDQASVMITIGSVNDAPVANDDAIAMAQEGGTASELVGGATSVLANDTDAEGDALTASLVSGATNGTFMLNADGTFVYTHDGSETTSDSVTYEACDPSAACDQATVMITIGSVNDAPVANDDAIMGLQEGGTANMLVGGATSVLANDTDADGDALTASLVSGAANGTFILNADGTFAYTHDGSETTSDSVTYEACDPSAACDQATVAITVTPANDAPVANDDSIDVAQGGTTVALVGGAASVLDNDTDADGDRLTAAIVSGPTNGTLSLNGDGTFSYTHDNGVTSTDQFTYQACDPSGSCDTAVVAITVGLTAPTLTLDKTTTTLSVGPAAEQVVWTIDVENVGGMTATGLVLTETVPSGSVFFASSSTGGWSCPDGVIGGTTCTLNVSDLVGQTRANADFAVLSVAPVASGIESLDNTVVLSADNMNDMTASDSVAVIAAPDNRVTVSFQGATKLNATKGSVQKISVNVGDVLNFAVSYANNGTQDASGVLLTATLPGGTALEASGSDTRWSCVDGLQGPCELAIDDLAVNETGTVTLAIRVIARASGALLVAIADDLASGPDIDLNNNQGSIAISAAAVPVPTLHLGGLLLLVFLILAAGWRMRGRTA